jgi:hypothetical protein
LCESSGSRDAVESKFRGNASLVISDDRASRVIRSVETLVTQPNLRDLMESLTL